MTVADISEYEVSLSLDKRMLFALVDWRKDHWADVVFEAMIAAPIASSTKYSRVDPKSPYLSDSYASIQISYEHGDFLSLKPLQTPHMVWGLGDSSWYWHHKNQGVQGLLLAS